MKQSRYLANLSRCNVIMKKETITKKRKKNKIFQDIDLKPKLVHVYLIDNPADLPDPPDHHLMQPQIFRQLLVVLLLLQFLRAGALSNRQTPGGEALSLPGTSRATFSASRRRGCCRCLTCSENTPSPGPAGSSLSTRSQALVATGARAHPEWDSHTPSRCFRHHNLSQTHINRPQIKKTTKHYFIVSLKH